ncbi:MAG: undecaprenyl-diphosphate phosphatase [Bryobacteraceae bacterium]
MPLYQVIILAIVQGFTEFLPISSSAHLALAPWLFGWRDQGLTFDIALHVGTLCAVGIYFFRDWIQVIAQAFGMPYGKDKQLFQNKNLLWMLAAASVPVGVCGLLLKEHAETTWRNPFVIGGMLIGVGLLMALAEKTSEQNRGIGGVGFFDSMIVGCAQALAIVPGTSRSGITMTAAMFRDIDRYSAARFSFLLSTPAIAAAAAKAFYDLMKQGGIPPDMRLQFVVGVVVSAITGCLVIAFFLKFLRRYSLSFFVYYRVIFGIIVIALAIFFRHPAE